MPYVIKDWDRIFENAQSRKVERIQWVPIPNKHDGKGFRRIATMAKRCEIFTGWVLLVELASKMPVRGVLSDSDGELSCTDMALKTGFPEAVFEVALEALKDPKVGWIIHRPAAGSALPDSSHPATTPIHRDGAEGNRREGNGKVVASSLPRTSRDEFKGNEISKAEEAVARAVEFTGDEGSRAFFQKAARELGPGLLEEAVGEVKARDLAGAVSHRGKYLTGVLMDWMEGRKNDRGGHR